MKSASTLILSVVLVLAIVGFAIFAIIAGGKISNNENSINTLEKNVTTLQTALNGSNGDIATLKGQIATANSQITTLQGQVTSDAAKITAAQTQVASATSQISTLQGQITALQTQGNSQDSQIAAANASVTALQTTVTSLQTTVTSLQATVNTLQAGGGTSGVTMIANYPLSTGPTNYIQVATFYAATSGTVVVAGYSSTTFGALFLANTTTGVQTTPVGLATTQTSVPIAYTAGTNVLYFYSTSGTTQGVITSVVRY
jgi:peptidoglycan hydrolase CwlO-like protein